MTLITANDARGKKYRVPNDDVGKIAETLVPAIGLIEGPWTQVKKPVNN